MSLKIAKNLLKLSRKKFHLSAIFAAGSQDDLKKRQADLMAKGLPKQQPIKGVNQILLVASGKGGVGKSTTSVNLAVGLKLLYPEKEIGLLDADVFGPCIPLMMNLSQSPMINSDNKMIPLVNYGVKCMSMGFLYEKHSPAVWRGLMVMSAIDRLLRQVNWAPLDYLIIDTPPGTGDTQLSLIQSLPITGVILVSTPQVAALEVTRRGAEMFLKLNVPIVGLVNNMSTVHCHICGGTHPVFGYTQAPAALADDLGIKLLQEIPLSPEITQGSDLGKPIIVAQPESPQAEAYKRLTEKVATFLKSQEERI